MPIVFYKEIQDFIERMINGETNVISSEKLIYFGQSSGTTGKQKMIPLTMGYFRTCGAVFNTSVGATMDYLHRERDYQFTCDNVSGQIAFNPSGHKKTPGGTPYGALSQSMRAMPFAMRVIVGTAWKIMSEIPFDVTDKVSHFETNLLLQVLFCIMNDKLGHLTIIFGSILSHFFALLKLHYRELIQCIEEASLSPCEAFCANISPDVLSSVDKYIQYTY